jgi:hypothetical protein
MEIKDLDELNNDTSSKESEFIKKADMKKATKNKGGRPKKSDKDKASEQIFTNLTKAEKKKVEEFAKDMGIATSVLVKISLKKFGAL